MRTLLYQCPAGLSGDMNLGAMVALGIDPNVLERELRKLPYHGWSLHFEADRRQGIQGIRCDVILEDAHAHGHGQHHSHSHRSFSDIRSAIAGSELAKEIKADAIACFHALAVAEGAVHGIAPAEVHFHEVGAIDSIVDMVGAAVCWHLLGVDRIVCTTLEVGGGTVQCAHGRMPVPAPATARLLEGKCYTLGGTDKEATTPTGAALLVGKGAEFGANVTGRQLKTAIGIGQRDDPKLANAVYVSLVEESEEALTEGTRDEVYELCTNIDDMPAEAIAYLCEQLFAAGALDVWQVPATFKKGRQGTLIHSLCDATLVQQLEAIYFSHSTTLGVRRHLWQRTKLQRALHSLETPWGTVQVKITTLPSGEKRHKFEHSDCARVAHTTQQSLAAVEAQLHQLYLKTDQA